MNGRHTAVATMLVAVLFAGASAAPVSALTVADIQAQIQGLISQIASLTGQSSAQSSAAVTVSPSFQQRVCSLLYRNLSRGMYGDDVRALQEFLQAAGYFSASPTGYYGPLTAQAVARWQASQGISPVGAVGPLTRERIRMMCGQGGSGTSVSGSFTASPMSGPAPLPVNFTYLPGSDESAQYYIEYGDGQGQLMDRQQIYCIRAPCISPSVAAHTYAAPGSYTATVNRYIACLYSNPRCMIAQPPPLASVQVTVFPSAPSAAPTISSFSGPTVLNVNQVGMWSVQASDPQNGPLSYHVVWGDEQYAAPASMSMAAEAFVQTTTFTHSYARAGTYTVIVHVRNSTGQQVQASATARIDGAPQYCTMEYAPVCGQKTSCPACYYSEPACLAPCSVEYKTYSNRCLMNTEGATLVHEGACTNPPYQP